MGLVSLFNLFRRESTKTGEIIAVNVDTEHDRLQEILQLSVSSFEAENVQLCDIVPEPTDFR